jgi:hypothetical protein
MSPRPLLVLPVLLLALAGCADAVEVTPKSESMPACADVWVGGDRLPADYEGCVDEDGVLQVSEIKQCTSADGSFTTYDGSYFALLGGTISDAGTSSQEYDALHAQCFGSDW